MQRSLKEEAKYLEGKLSKNANSILFARLADAYLQMDRVDDAIELCEKGIRKHPYYVTGHYVLGKCYFKKKLFDQAEKELKRVLLFDPKYLAAHRDYGELMAQIGWHNTCEMSYSEILRIDPFNEAARKRLEELRQPGASTPAPTSEPPLEKELAEAEEDILAELTPNPEKPSQPQREAEPKFEPEPYAETLPELELEPEPQSLKAEEDELDEIVSEARFVETEAEPTEKKAFKEIENVYEDDKANLDLLEDIFRDDEPLDELVNEETENQSFEDSDQPIEEEAAAQDQNYLYGEEFKAEETDESDNKEFDGLDDEEVFALIAGDEELNKPVMKSPLDISEPPVRKVPGPQSESRERKAAGDIRQQAEADLAPPLKKALNAIQHETRPRFEPSLGKAALQQQKEANLSEGSKLSNTNDLQRKKEKIVTPTLGEIYAAQHQYAKAIGVYEILRKKEPDNELYIQKIEYLQKKLEESQSE